MAEGLDVLRAFARHLRDPASPAPEGVAPKRLALYRELFLRNVEGLLAGSFPVCRRLLGETGFRTLAAEFFARHRSRTPYFPRLAEEFLAFLGERAASPGWLRELAHYEWAELALAIEPIELSAVAAVPGDLLDRAPVANPLAWVMTYRWPVHRLSTAPPGDEVPERPTHLLLVRGRDDRVRFYEVAPWTIALLEQLREAPGCSGREHLEILADRLGHSRAALLETGRVALERLLSAEAVLGVAPVADRPSAGRANC